MSLTRHESSTAGPPEVGTLTSHSSQWRLSIWAFPRETYGEALRDYFRFCRDYFKKSGYRCDLLNVGYSIAQDRKSNFSYARKGPALTLDPVATGASGWDEFITAYNEFCIQHGGTPLFNQTRGITPLQARAALGDEIDRFVDYRRRMDPDDRFYTPYFRSLFE